MHALALKFKTPLPQVHGSRTGPGLADMRDVFSPKFDVRRPVISY